MTAKRFERIYADVDVFCRDHNAKGLSQLIEKEDYDTIVDLLNSLNDEKEQLKQQLSNVQTLYKSTDDNLFACRETNNELRECYSKLEKENEQLRQQEKRLYKYFRKCFENVSEQGFRETWEVVKNND